MKIKTYPYKRAKEAISSVCSAAAEDEFDTREKFMSILDSNPYIAAQGYNTHGKIFYWNDASVHVYGHSESAAFNHDLFELIMPEEMRGFARDMVQSSAKTGRMPDPRACDLVQYNGESITVFCGHLVFYWDSTYPEFYCIGLPLEIKL